MRLEVLLLLTVTSFSSAVVVAQELPDPAKAIEEIERLGGRVKPDKASPSQTGISVSFCGCANFDDDSVHLLKSIENVTLLDLTDTGITDAGLKELAGLQKLEKLFLQTTGITDAGLTELRQFENLSVLSLNGTQVTDAGLLELKHLKNLSTLDLARTQVTDEGLKYLAGLTQLKRISTMSTQVTDDGLNLLKQTIPNLQVASDRDDTSGGRFRHAIILRNQHWRSILR